MFFPLSSEGQQFGYVSTYSSLRVSDHLCPSLSWGVWTEASVTSFGPLLYPWSLSSMNELIFSSFLFASRTVVFLSQFLLSGTSTSTWINHPIIFQFVIFLTPLIYLHPSQKLYSVIYHLTLGNTWSYNSKHPNFHPWFPIFLVFKNPYLSQCLSFF